jgi:hypothetical protein
MGGEALDCGREDHVGMFRICSHRESIASRLGRDPPGLREAGPVSITDADQGGGTGRDYCRGVAAPLPRLRPASTFDANISKQCLWPLARTSDAASGAVLCRLRIAEADASHRAGRLNLIVIDFSAPAIA